MSALNRGAVQALELLEPMNRIDLRELAPAAARGAFNALIGAMQAAPADVQIDTVEIETAAGGLPLRIYRPRAAAERRPGILFFHGGGFVLGELGLYDAFCSRFAEACGAVVLSVEYRLAPEHPFPAALDDAMAATDWLVSKADALGIDPARLAISGDSAGANLAAVTCLRLRDAGRPVFAQQILLYPVLRLPAKGEGYARHPEGYFLSETMIHFFAEQYLGADGDRSDWRVSPLAASSHQALPAATILVCGFDPLHDEGVAYAERLREAGVPVSLMRCEDQIHGFLLMDRVIPAAAETIRQIAAQVGDCFASQKT